MAEKSPFSQVGHIGMVVRDVDKAVEYYESLGIGPFELPMQWVSTEKWVMGKPVPPDSIVNKERIIRIGPVMLQLIQPVKGESLWKEFLETKGEGINHLGFHVEDIDREQAKMEQRGFTVLFASRFSQGGGCAYFDTGTIGGVLTEFIQWVD